MVLWSVNLELPDLTHARTVELFRQWNGDLAYLHLLRFIRVSSADPTSISIVRYGLQERENTSMVNHSNSVDASLKKGDSDDAPSVTAMEIGSELHTTERPVFLPGFPGIPMSQFASTMPSMDAQAD